MKAWLLGLSAMSCSMTLNGQRSATPADMAAPIEARFVCLTPLTMKVEGKAIREFVPPSEVILAKGPIVIEGQYVTHNHWQAPDGDHFFSWASEVAAETLVAPDRATAFQFLWAPQPGDDTAYKREQAPDGSMRPSGTPMMVSACIPTAEAQKRLAAGVPMLTRAGLKPISSDAIEDRVELRNLTCSRNGAATVAVSSPSNLGTAAWVWMPTGLFRDVKGKKYVTWSSGRIGLAVPFYEIEPDAEGRFAFSAGPVNYKGWAAVVKDKEVGEITGTLDVLGHHELRCVYGR